MKKIIFFCAVMISQAVGLNAADYDPTSAEGKVDVHLTSFSYTGREVPLKIYLPKKKGQPAPLILLSHGLGGSREAGTYIGKHWAARGYVVVAMQHAGSDESLWKDVPAKERMKALQAGMSAKSFLARMKDVPATLDQLEQWSKKQGHILNKSIDFTQVGLAGHSYGAVTTQALAGQKYGIAGARFADSRIDAAIALSPSPPRRGDATRAFASITMPMMLMTGTKDGSPFGKPTPQERLEVFPALPKGEKYQVVLKDAEHHAFADQRFGKGKVNPNHHRVIKALSGAFWDSTLKKDAEAKKWLLSKKPKALMQEGDLWQLK